MLYNGATLMEVQGALGHDRPETTMNYLHPAEDAAREGQRKLAQARATGKPELKIMKGGQNE